VRLILLGSHPPLVAEWIAGGWAVRGSTAKLELTTIGAGESGPVVEPLIIVAGVAHDMEPCAVSIGLVKCEGLIHRIKDHAHPWHEGLLQHARDETVIPLVIVGGDGDLILILLRNHLIVIILISRFAVEVVGDLLLDPLRLFNFLAEARVLRGGGGTPQNPPSCSLPPPIYTAPCSRVH
jgi:hypothetical protein